MFYNLMDNNLIPDDGLTAVCFYPALFLYSACILLASLYILSFVVCFSYLPFSILCMPIHCIMNITECILVHYMQNFKMLFVPELKTSFYISVSNTNNFISSVEMCLINKKTYVRFYIRSDPKQIYFLLEPAGSDRYGRPRVLLFE